MNILIVGHTSMVGKRVLSMLHSFSNISIFTVGRHVDASIYLDFENGQSIVRENSLPVMDVVINCVSSFESDDIEGVIKNLEINTRGLAYLLKVLEKVDFHRFINLSTIFSIEHTRNQYYGSYGMSKRHGYEYLKYYCTVNNKQLINLLIGPLYDEHGEARKHQGFLYHILEQSFLGKEINIYGKKNVYRNYLHVIDLANIIVRLIHMEVDKIEEYVCCDIRNYSIHEIASLSNEVFNNSSNIRFLADQDDLKTIYIPKDHTLYEQVDYYPKIDLRLGMELFKEQRVKKL